MSSEFFAMILMVAVSIAIAFFCIAYAIDTIQNIYLKHRDREYDDERIHFEGYMEGFKEGCKLHKEIAERRAEKKPNYPIYTDDDCKIILLKDETNAQKISDR